MRLHLKHSLLLLPIHLLAATSASVFGETFDEELVLQPKRDGRVVANFAFTTVMNGAFPRNPDTLGMEDRPQHYTLFPLALGQILREYAITELHLTLNAGKWNYEDWGYPLELGVGSGAELWAWMGESIVSSVDERWVGLRNALAGLFCASLGSMDNQRTTSPAMTFKPEGELPRTNSSYQLRHATLPSEHVCTENLTPFLKLLPCKSLSGIASLVNPHRLFDADWHGLGVHVRYVRDAGIEVRLSFQAVFDPVRYSLDKKRDWSFRSLFDRSVDRSCPVAQSSRVRVQLPAGEHVDLFPTPSIVPEHVAIYDVNDASAPLDVALSWPEENTFQFPLHAPPVPLTELSVQRTLRGPNQSRGHLTVVITNHEPVAIKASYLETMPWLLQFYLSSLRVWCDGIPADGNIISVDYIPPVPHARPTSLQAILTLPAKSQTVLTMDVIKPFLRYTEHPPDAQRGWDLPPAVLVPLNSDSLAADAQLNSTTYSARHSPLRRIYTPTLLVDLATPDFSMPYNVIIMSCTLIALIFGSVFNLLTRKFVLVSLTADAQANVE